MAAGLCCDADERSTSVRPWHGRQCFLDGVVMNTCPEVAVKALRECKGMARRNPGREVDMVAGFCGGAE
jgi:hypothetical protein